MVGPGRPPAREAVLLVLQGLTFTVSFQPDAGEFKISGLLGLRSDPVVRPHIP